VPAETLPAYRIVAENHSRASENAIHDDVTARRYGFRGGLVPGVTVYAYLTEPVVAALGTAWLDRGTANVRFVKPAFEGETVVVSGTVTSRDKDGVAVEALARTDSSGDCGLMTAAVPAGLPTPVNLRLYRDAPLPEDRPAATREHFLSLKELGTPVAAYDEACASQYLAKVGDPLPVYRGAGARVHPAFYLDQANKALSLNVRMGPWIHVQSTVRHLGAARVGDTLRTLGRVRSVFEKKGREFVEADLVIVAGESWRPVAHVLHTAIYRLPAPA
jgi:acyl dehydratase